LRRQRLVPLRSAGLGADGIDLELRYRGLRAPHKIKMGVSGCARDWAEARGKDVGVIATETDWTSMLAATAA
jgi:NAD(P)H-nitrite reductase large subunit